MIDLFFTNWKFVSQEVNWWTGVVWIICGLRCFYQLFGLSFWRHPFTKEHPLVSRWCNATFLQIWWRNKVHIVVIVCMHCKLHIADSVIQTLSCPSIHLHTIMMKLVSVSRPQLGDGGQRLFYLNHPGDYEQAWHHGLGERSALSKLH